jgi:CRISPR-associated endonuclease/helicase Cas3
LQTRHVFVRLFGLANKTVVLDEVHAYDAYMSTLLERLLAWLAALGCSVVLLSATLPRARRRRLLEAFAAGADVPEVPYPRMLAVQGNRAWATEFPAARAVSLGLDWVALDDLGQRLLDSLSGGGCAAVICNTVRRAQEVFLALRECLTAAGIEVGLFHARFPFGQRDAIERDVLERFGLPVNNPKRPRAAVLVATQVIEQSLDLDFDLMVSEVAPADLVLQRAGRLHRHASRQRPPLLGQPQLWLLRPAGCEVEGVPDFDKSEYVYDRHVLLRSYLALSGRHSLNLPEDLEVLIETVYGELTLAVPDDAWQAALDSSRKELEENQARDRQKARNVIIKPPDYDNLEDFCQELEEDNPEVQPTLQALTRLGDLTVAVVCLHRTPAGLSLSADGREPVDLSREPTLAEAKLLLRSALSLSYFALVKHFLAQDVPPGWRRSPLLRHHKAAVFDGGVLQAGRFTLRLDPELGAVIEAQPAGGGTRT